MKITNIKKIEGKPPSGFTKFMRWVLTDPDAKDIVLSLGHGFNVFFFGMLVLTMILIKNYLFLIIFSILLIVVSRRAYKYFYVKIKLGRGTDGTLLESYDTLFGGK